MVQSRLPSHQLVEIDDSALEWHVRKTSWDSTGQKNADQGCFLHLVLVAEVAAFFFFFSCPPEGGLLLSPQIRSLAKSQ
jgi:hypothetical protein